MKRRKLRRRQQKSKRKRKKKKRSRKRQLKKPLRLHPLLARKPLLRRALPEEITRSLNQSWSLFLKHSLKQVSSAMTQMLSNLSLTLSIWRDQQLSSTTSSKNLSCMLQF